MRSLLSTLAYGVHMGDSEIRQDLPGFSLSVLKPTLHAEDVPVHTHHSATMIFVVEGCYLTSADGPRRLSPGPFLIYNPAGTTHRDSFTVPKGRFLAVSLSDDVMRLAANGGELPGVAVSFCEGDAIAAAQRVLQDCVAGDHGSQSSQSSQSNLEDSCWELLASVSRTRVWDARTGTGGPSWLARAREILNDDRSGALGIAGIAGALGIHPIYFARSFRRYFGCTPAAYRTRCRLRRAMDLLCRSDRSLLEIALETGFFDQSHFSTAFKKHFGHSPGMYRQRIEANAASPAEVAYLQERGGREDGD